MAEGGKKIMPDKFKLSNQTDMSTNEGSLLLLSSL